MPIFWSLFDQQGSKWVLQAEHTSGEISFFKWDYNLRADQFQVFNPIFIVAMIPLFEYIIYPIFKKFNFCTRPLQRMSLGGLLAALSFVCAAFLEMHIEENKITGPSDGQINLNLILLNSKKIETVNLFAKNENLMIQNAMGSRFINFNTIPANNYSLNAKLTNDKNFTELLNLKNQKAYTVVIYEKNNELAYELDENVIRPSYEKMQLKIYFNQEKLSKLVDLILIKSRTGKTLELKEINTKIYRPPMMELDELSDGYDIIINGKVVYKFVGKVARSYKLIILAKENGQVRLFKF